MKIKNTYEVRIYKGSEYTHKGEHRTLEEAIKYLDLKHTEQCTWDDIEIGLIDKGIVPEYSVVFHYRDDEHYNDMYFIAPESN